MALRKHIIQSGRCGNRKGLEEMSEAEKLAG
jgi:hypothetical protein